MEIVDFSLSAAACVGRMSKITLIYQNVDAGRPIPARVRGATWKARRAMANPVKPGSCAVSAT